MIPPGGFLSAGRVGRPHGLDGSFYVIDAIPALLNVGESVILRGSERRILRRAGAERRPIVRLEGCEEREAARDLGGSAMLVPRAGVPELEPDVWWAQDLEGCHVSDGGRAVGTVKRLVPLPSCEALEVECPDGAELLIPLVVDAVRSVDVEHREIDVDLGFLGESRTCRDDS